MRDASIAVLREIGVETGGSNVQFAVNPRDGRLVVIEMNPRVSRSSALASKATGFPDRQGRRQARGRLHARRDRQRHHRRRHAGLVRADHRLRRHQDPALCLREISRRRAGAHHLDEIGRRGDGDRPHLCQESLQKALRSLETGLTGLDEIAIPGLGEGDDKNAIRAALGTPSPDGLLKVAQAMRLGMSDADIHTACRIDPWFLAQIRGIVDTEAEIRAKGLPATARALRRLKAMGFSDARLGRLTGSPPRRSPQRRRALGVRPVFKRIDTCAAEFASPTAYMYSTYEAPFAGRAADEAAPSDKKKVVILGGGPNRIGQGIEFDYCCCHAAFALKEVGYETIMINCNPETVSTDYDTSDRLYFEPLTAEDVLEIIDTERKNGTLHGVIVQFGGQTPLKLAEALEKAQVPILGTSPDAIDLAEDRDRFKQLLDRLKLRQPKSGIATSAGKGARDRRRDRLSDRDPPVLCARRPRHGDRARRQPARPLRRAACRRSRPAVGTRGVGQAAAADRPLSHRRHRGRCRLPRRRQATPISPASWSTSRRPAFIPAIPPARCRRTISRPRSIAELDRQTRALALALKVGGLMNVQYAIKDGDIYVLEVNPRASRTVPFVAKVTGIPAAKIAARIMAGETLGELSSSSRRLRIRHRAPCRRQGSGVPVRALRRQGRYRARPGNEIDRRSHGHRPRLQCRLRQKPARRRHAAAEKRHGLRLGARTPTSRAFSNRPGCSPSSASRSWRPREPSATSPNRASPRSRSTRSPKAARTSSTPSKTARFSWFSTPPRGPPRSPTAVRCGAQPSCIKCRTTPLFQGPSPQRRASKPISGATSRCVRCRAISGPRLIQHRGGRERRHV